MTESSPPSWYVRRGSRCRGPYDAPQIQRYLLLGRIREGDEVSVDGRRWERLDAAHPLYPMLLRDADSPEGFARLMAVRERIDERRAGRRRVVRGGMRLSARSQTTGDRRRGEDPFLEALRRRAGVEDSGATASRRRRWVPGLLALLVLVLWLETHP